MASQQPKRLQFPQGAPTTQNLMDENQDRYYQADTRQELDHFELQSQNVRRSIDQFPQNTHFTPHKLGRSVSKKRQFTEEKSYRTNEPPYQFQEKAIPLVSVKGNGKFELNQEVVQMMEHVKGPIGVVAVAGMYRTGKSYLLNRLLLNRKKGFNVGPTINPCTKGIWIWGTPLKSFTSTGEPCNVLIVDSEGIGGLDEDNNHDMRIFSLALLLSSYFIYNSMSQIDENALSNLSLVVNLTKHIQTTAGTMNKDENADDLDAYLPAFMWVVRDFALQLQDEQGTNITDREYLELALQQKGSNQAEPKNQIRAALLKHFKRRDCCTMIRPLVDEDLLQRLEEMDIQDLRSEFIEQVVNLRKKVLGKIPVKKMKGTPMDGSTWMGLLKLYTQAFNEDRVPNVDSSWSYICKQKAEQSLIKATDHFESTLEEVQFPTNHEELNVLLENSFTQSIQQFENSLLEPSIARDVHTRLITTLKERINELQMQNMHSCYEFAEQMLLQLVMEVEQLKQMQQDPQLYQQVDYALSQLSQFYEEQCVEFPDKRLYLAETKLRFLSELFCEQVKFHHQQNHVANEIENQMKERFAIQLRETKEESRVENQRIDAQLRATQIQKRELEAQHQILKDQLENIKSFKQNSEIESSLTIQNLKDQLQKLNQELALKKDQFEDQIKEIQRNLKQSASNFDKEKALYEQKILFLEQTLKDQTQRELNFSLGNSQKNSELSQEIKMITQKYEQELKQIQNLLDNQLETTAELEAQLSEQIQLKQADALKHSEVEQTLTQSLSTSQLKIQDLQQQLQKTNFSQNSIPIDRLKQKEAELVTLTKQIEEFEVKLKQQIEQNQLSSHESKKQIAMRDQKIEFLQMQLNESKEILEESQHQHQNLIKMLNDQDQSYKPTNLQHEQLILFNKDLEKQYEALNSQILDAAQINQSLKSQILDLERENQNLKSEISKQTQSSRSSIQDLEQQKLNLTEKIKTLETQLKQSNQEQISIRQELLQQNKKDIQDIQENHALEIKESSQGYESQIQQMRQFYDAEKEICDQRVLEEKERFSRKLQQVQDELEIKHKEDQHNYESEITALQDQLHHIKTDQVTQTKQLEQELLSKKNLINQLEHQLQEIKDHLKQSELTKSQSFDKSFIQLEQHKNSLQEKIDQLTNTILEKERQLSGLQHKIERQNDQIERMKSEQITLEQSTCQERQTLLDKYETNKKKMAELQDELIQRNNESSRQQALLEQQVEFQNKKIEDMQRSADNTQKQFDEKIRIYRQEIFADAQAQVDRVTSEKDLWESKYDQKRRALKEVEAQLSASVLKLEKQNVQLQSQLTRLNSELEHKESNYTQETQNLKQQLANLDSSAGQAYFLGSAQAEDMIRLKGQLQECERELQDCQSNYDRDRALWEGKCLFLEQQKDTYKRDLIESQRKFQMTLEQLQKRSSQDKEKQESNQNQMIKMLESKYKNQIKDIVTANQILVSELQYKIKRLESELPVLQEKSITEARGKLDDTIQLERKLADSEQMVQQLNNELQEEKQERQRRLTEIQRQLEREKEVNKQKLIDLDKKNKDTESRRAQLYFQIEKDRTGWLLETEQNQRKLQELQDQVQSLERTKEQLKKENDKLRGNHLNGISSGNQRSDSALAGQNHGEISRFFLNTSGLMRHNDQNYNQVDSQGQGNGIQSSGQSILSGGVIKFKENQIKPTITQPQINFKPTVDKKDLLLNLPIQQGKTQSNRYKLTQGSLFSKISQNQQQNQANDTTDYDL